MKNWYENMAAAQKLFVYFAVMLVGAFGLGNKTPLLFIGCFILLLVLVYLEIGQRTSSKDSQQ